MHFVSIKTSKAKPKLIYQTVVDVLGTGIVSCYNVGEKVAKMKKNGDTFTIPCVRPATETEMKVLFQSLSSILDDNFELTTSNSPPKQEEVSASLEEDLITDIAKTWAKYEHDLWLKGKQSVGWQYGSTVDAKNKRHPLIRQFSELPEKYQKPNTGKVNAFVKMLTDNGYIISKKNIE